MSIFCLAAPLSQVGINPNVRQRLAVGIEHAAFQNQPLFQSEASQITPFFMNHMRRRSEFFWDDPKDGFAASVD